MMDCLMLAKITSICPEAHRNSLLLLLTSEQIEIIFSQPKFNPYYSVTPKRANIYYLEKCCLLQKDGRVVYLTDEKFRLQLKQQEKDKLVAICDQFKALKYSPAPPYIDAEQRTFMDFMFDTIKDVCKKENDNE